MSTEDGSPTSPPPSACPVDHKSREVWLKAAQQQQQQQSTATSTKTSIPPSKRPKFTDTRTLSTDRQVSSIPRGSITTTSPHDQASATTAASASHGPSSPSPNAETSNPSTSTTGHWLYPSEAQFFQAVIRKHGPSTAAADSTPTASRVSSSAAPGANTSATTTPGGTSAQPSDMKTIIPLHNAINERTWQQILAWERGRGGERCGGPKLVSFSGDSTRLTPRARWLGLLGYTRPFDRHDWVVERCGTRVEYVIDFYQGRAQTKQPEAGVNFYLDVRPKLNSWEGLKMRVGRFFGF